MMRRWRLRLPLPPLAMVAAAVLAAAFSAAPPAAAQTLINLLKPGSPEIAQVLCDRFTAFGVPGVRVYALENHRVRVEIDAAAQADLDLDAAAELMVVPGAFSIRLVGVGPGEDSFLGRRRRLAVERKWFPVPGRETLAQGAWQRGCRGKQGRVSWVNGGAEGGQC